jgi:hypothetical protein
MHLLRQTPESVAAAREAQARDRAATGLRFNHDGTIRRFPVEILCPQCLHACAAEGLSEGEAEGKAVRNLIKHIVAKHGRRMAQ